MNKFSFLLIGAWVSVYQVGWAKKAPVKAKAESIVKEITVYRSPTCSCCEKWLAHMQENHFKINDNVIEDMQAIKTKYGVTAELASCHTALAGGYVVEGHVPASDIEQLLIKKPNVLGLAVPGMPTGTPGMEMGTKKDAYNVYSFDNKNPKAVFNSYSGN